MFKRKYGRIKVGAWLSLEMEQSSPLLMLLFGVGYLIAGIAVRIGVGSPYPVLLALGIGEIVPPVWLLSLLWSISFFSIGCAFGFLLAYREKGCNGEKYKGGMLFLLLLILELLWYPTFFGGGYVFVSVLLSILILCVSVWITAIAYRVTKFTGMLLLLHDIWLIYMMILNFTVLFHC
ncbi:MAG: tryptophan-rich sensory protein [Clostridia bacterium]|nr:tryptophan-rich sensory protein [Clostridia bacterium]